MRLAIEKRDLFTVSKDYFLCHCISSDFALGAGIAKKFAELGVRDELKKTYGRFVWYETGVCLYTHSTDWKGEYNLVTKEKYWHKPTLNSLGQSLIDLKYSAIHTKKIAMPRIGCGLDKLNWIDVEKIIYSIFGDTDIEILVCDWR